MKINYYTLLVQTGRRLGPWIFAVISRTIAVGYFFFSGRVEESRRFYAALFPDRGRLYHLWCAFRQYQNFTTIHYDRFLSDQGRQTKFSAQGKERLERSIGTSGAILLMSHLGNWEMAARLLMEQRQDLQLLLYMGVKEKEGVERLQKEELRRAGVTIIGADQESGSPFAAVEGIRLLQAGGVVSMTGDIVWRADQRSIAVNFLGHIAYVPEAPFIFAMVSGAPIFVFFAFRTGVNTYRFILSEAISISPANKTERKKRVAEAAQRYADLLEEALRSHPFEWYHFDRFIHPLPTQSEGTV